MTLEELLDELEGVRSQGGYWMARCPAHDDRTQSLQVSEREDGSLGVYCHAGCDTEQVMLEIGCIMSDLRPETEDVVYVYRDINGSYIYEKVRQKGRKDFTQRRLLEDGSYLYKLEDIDKTLYRIDEVFQSDPARTVWLVEGEKDADRVWSEGGVGTTQGGTNDWRPEFAALLKGRDVCVWQDNDAGGRKTATQMMLDLRDQVRNVFVREAARGKDASDHFDAGYDFDDVIMPALFRVVDFTKEAPQPTWILDGYLAKGDLALFSGPPKIGKSWWTQALAVAVANGFGSFLGLGVVNGPVLYFDEENPLDVIYRRLVGLGHSNYGELLYVSGGGLRLDTHPERLLQQAMISQPVLIIIDSLARVHAKDENSFSEMSEILNGVLRQLARDTGAGVILIHHNSKHGGPRGSSDIEAAVDIIISANGTPGAGEFWITRKGRRASTVGDSLHVVVRDIPGVGTRVEKA